MLEARTQNHKIHNLAIPICVASPYCQTIKSERDESNIQGVKHRFYRATRFHLRSTLRKITCDVEGFNFDLPNYNIRTHLSAAMLSHHRHSYNYNLPWWRHLVTLQGLPVFSGTLLLS